MLLNYTYRIKPDQQQTQLLDEWLETLRVSYNYALRELKRSKNYEKARKKIEKQHNHNPLLS
jgi:transposase